MKIANPIRLFAVLCVDLWAHLREFAASVCGLFFASSPADIAKGVIAVVVYPLNGMSWRRALSDVADERLKTLKFNSDAPTAVTREILNIWIGAATLHSGPNTILGASRALSSLAVPRRVWALNLNAPAAAGVPASELIDSDLSQLPARARANPFRAGSVLTVNSPQTPKSLAGKIKSFHGKHLTRRHAPTQVEMAA